MDNFNDIKIFGKTSLADIFKQIHKNNKDIDEQINNIIDTVQPFVNNAGSAVMLLPVVKDLIDVNVKNNDQLVKLAAIAQRAATANMSKQDDLINPEEIAQILEEQKSLTYEGQKLLKQKDELIKSDK